jgi:probable addiction module antidote protein/putative addiction module killer protein
MPIRVEQTEVYRDWINALKDRTGRARIQVRVDRLVHGNPGSHRNLTDGVSELKIDVGPGYRVYYTQRGDRLLLLLVGGDKSTPQKTSSALLRVGTWSSGAVSMAKAAAKKVPKTKTTPYDVAEQLRTPKEMAAYLDAWLDEAPDDASGIARALGDIARAKGMSQVAKEAGLSRESLYRALSADGNPSFATVLKVARALGVKLHAAAA